MRPHIHTSRYDQCIPIVLALLILLASSHLTMAQWHKDLGIGVSTNGIGIDMGAERPSNEPTLTNRLSLNLSNIKHPAQTRVQNQEYANARPYVFQKVNSLYAARISYGWKKNLSYSELEKPQISLSLSAGPTWAVTKPYYIGYENSEGQLVIGVQNQETLENQNKILGPSRWSKGINELSNELGIHTELSLNVKWNHSLFYKYWQTGVRLDYFPSGIELMYKAESTVFTSIYTSYSFGRK